MIPIDTSDLVLINNLSSRRYTGNRLLSNATEAEKSHLDRVVKKLGTIAEYFSRKYSIAYGPFETSVTTGNAIAIGGTSFKESGLEFSKVRQTNSTQHRSVLS